MSLHPQVRAFLDERNRVDPHIDYTRITAPELRACFAIPASAAPSGTQSLRIEEHRIAVRSGEIGLRLYIPSTSEPAPITVFFHGGGFCIGDLNTTDSLC